MAIYRPIFTQIWNDPDFQKFTESEKIVFMCLFTCDLTTESGVYVTTFQTIAGKTNIPEEKVEHAIIDIFQNQQEKVVYDPQNSIIWVKNFLKHNGHMSPHNLIVSILNDYQDTRKSNVWDGFWEYNSGILGAVIKKSKKLQREIAEGEIALPDGAIKTCARLIQDLVKT